MPRNAVHLLQNVRLSAIWRSHRGLFLLFYAEQPAKLGDLRCAKAPFVRPDCTALHVGPLHTPPTYAKAMVSLVRSDLLPFADGLELHEPSNIGSSGRVLGLDRDVGPTSERVTVVVAHLAVDFGTGDAGPSTKSRARGARSRIWVHSARHEPIRSISTRVGVGAAADAQQVWFSSRDCQ